MRIGRTTLAVACAVLASAPAALAQRGPAQGGATVRIDTVTPAVLEVGSSPVEVTLAGTGFAAKALVRVRRAGDRGNGVDAVTTVDGATTARARVPAEFLDKPGSLELRLRNPDGATTEWTTLDVRAAAPLSGAGGGEIGSRKPVIERVSPETLEANSRSLHVTLFGRDLADGAVVAFRAGNTQAESRANLVNRTLVVPVPDEILAKPQTVLFTVRNPGGGVSDSIRIEVVAPVGGPSTGEPTDLAIAQAEPRRADMRNNPSQRIELIVRGADREGAKVLLRREGSSETGKLVPVVERTTATNGTVIVVQITPAMVRETGAYELRVVNPNGKQSNWTRVEFVNADPGVGNSGATVEARFPESVTLTSVTAWIPIELTVRNAGRLPVRVSDFALVTDGGAATAVAGSIEVPEGATRPLRLEAPAPIGAPTATARVRVALTYKLTLVSSRNPSFDGRSPDDGFATVAVRTEIGLESIAREYVRAKTPGAAEGWRFFKTANEANAGSGTTADFYLFAEPFGSRDAIPTEALYNYRPDESAPADRGLFYLVLRDGELSTREARARERGTRLGYMATRQAPGLVPLYRWALPDQRRTVNHYVTTESDVAKLPRQLQRGAWKNEGVIGYVVPRS